MLISIPHETYNKSYQICLTSANDLSLLTKELRYSDDFFRAAFSLIHHELLDTATLMKKQAQFKKESNVYYVDHLQYDILLSRIVGITGIAIAFYETLKTKELMQLTGKLLSLVTQICKYK